MSTSNRQTTCDTEFDNVTKYLALYFTFEMALSDNERDEFINMLKHTKFYSTSSAIEEIFNQLDIKDRDHDLLLIDQFFTQHGWIIK